MEAEQDEPGNPGEICPGCGRGFRCGMKAGCEPCWCAALPPLPGVPVGGAAGCYCRECLTRMLEAAAGSGQAGDEADGVAVGP
jgi:hypothetical protein